MQGGESVHCVAAYAQHRARLVGAEYRVGRCDEPHLAPANALGHGRPRAPLVSRLPRVPGRGRLLGRSPPSFPTAPRLDVGVHGRPRNQELPAEPVRVDLSRPDEVVRLAPARPHVLLHLDHRHPFVAALAALGRGAFRRVRYGCLQSSARCVCAVVNSRLSPGTEKSILVPWIAVYEGGAFDTGN